MHPDHRENLPARMAKRVRDYAVGDVRRSMRENKGQRVRADNVVDPSYLDFDEDDEFRGKRKTYEIDE